MLPSPHLSLCCRSWLMLTHGPSGKPSFCRQLLVHLGIKPASTATHKPSVLHSNQAPPAAKPWPGTKSQQWTMRLGPRLRQPLAILCHLQWGLSTPTLLKGMFLYHLKPRRGLSSLMPSKALERKLALNGWSTVAEQLAQAVDLSGAHRTLTWAVGWERDLQVSCHGVHVHLLWIWGGVVSACALPRSFAEARGSPLQVRGSILPALELRELPETNPSGSNICATWCPTTMGLPVPRGKHATSEYLSQKHISEGSPKEKNLLIGVSAASCVLQTLVRIPFVSGIMKK